MTKTDKRRYGVIEVRQINARTYWLEINGVMWSEVEWSRERQRWCIQDGAGHCLTHVEHIVGQDKDPQTAIRLAKKMIVEGYLAKSCSKEVPAQPVARLQLMESQLEELSMALNIARQPLLDFEQSLNADQQSRLAVASSQGPPSGNIAGGCGSPSAIDWSINELNQSLHPTAAQRDALDDVRRSFNDAARDLETHCPTTIPASALNRLDVIQARLDSTWRATLSIQVALANFETELNEAQKIHFDAMNFAARETVQPVQRDAGSGH